MKLKFIFIILISLGLISNVELQANEQLIRDYVTLKLNLEMLSDLLGPSKVAKEQAAKEQAAKEQAAKEQAAKEQAAKEQAAKEQAAKEQAAKEQAAKEQAAKEEAAKEQAEKEKKEEEEAPIFEPEEYIDVEIAESKFSEDDAPHYSVAGANSAINKIDVLRAARQPNPEEAVDITEELIAKITKAVGQADEEQLTTLLEAITKLMKAFPSSIANATQALEKVNQYEPGAVFSTLISVLSPKTSAFAREIKKETTRNALSMAEEGARKGQRRYIREALVEALTEINLILDQYDKYKDYGTVSNLDKNQFFGQILFNWLAIKKGHEAIATELSEEDRNEILSLEMNLPQISDPQKLQNRPVENYYQETRKRIEGLGIAEEVLKPLRILLGKISTSLKDPSEDNKNGLKNFTKSQIPSKMDEAGPFLEYNYSEFDTLEKKRIVVKTLKEGAKALQGSEEAITLFKLAEEIDKYYAYKNDNDELDNLIDQMKTDPSKFSTTDAIEEIIKKIDSVGKKAADLSDPSLKRDEKADKELKDDLKKTKEAINIGSELAPVLAESLTKFCAGGMPNEVQNVIDYQIKGKDVTFELQQLQQMKTEGQLAEQQQLIRQYQNASRAQQLLILQSILSILIERCPRAECPICTRMAGQQMRDEIKTENPNAPDWVKESFK